MTDIQILTIAMTLVIPLSLLIYSNSRITDVNHRIDDVKEALRNEIKASEARLQAEIRSGFGKMETMLKIHELEHHK